MLWPERYLFHHTCLEFSFIFLSFHLYSFCFWLTTPLASFISPSFLFFCFESVSLSTCCSIVGTEEICHVITPALPVSLVFPALLSKGLQYLVVTSTQKRPNKGFTCLEKTQSFTAAHTVPLMFLTLSKTIQCSAFGLCFEYIHWTSLRHSLRD